MMNVLLERVERELAMLPLEPGTDSRRWFHGRGCTYVGFEQVTVDWFDPVVMVTLFKASDDSEKEQRWLQALCDRVQNSQGRIKTLLVQRRYLPMAPSDVLWGEVPDTVFARRGALHFELALAEHQNLGFFLDMEPGREWLASHAQGKSVLNLFAYTCAFSVVAVEAGADSVVNVDMSRAALSRGRRNHRLNGQGDARVSYLAENILKSWGRIKRQGPYDLVIIDPPSYQKGSFIAQRDYGKLVRRLPELMNAGGDVLLCLNAPELDEGFLDACLIEQGIGCDKIARLPAHPDFPDVDPQRQLKLVHYRWHGGVAGALQLDSPVGVP